VKVLFDHNIPKKLRTHLPGHDVTTSRELGWDALKNGELLAVAELNGFEVMVTGDKNLSYQQNLKGRQLALIVLGESDWNILKHVSKSVATALEEAGPGSFQEVLFGHQRRSKCE
jgi:predicted nuclease of predicted toxin-antitoxin system